MSCLGPNYNPVPPRAWSRVQNACTSADPTVSTIAGDVVRASLAKGNVLQYKKNSANLTKAQRYSKIATGNWTNQNTTWASQTSTYTNPNTLNLQQVGFTPIPLPEPVRDLNGCVQTFLKDGGSLLCNTTVNPCTDEVISRTRVTQCTPSTASDVPGPMVLLCWDSSLQTWYPRSTRTMNNSGNKWPQNYKLFRSANSLPSKSYYDSATFQAERRKYVYPTTASPRASIEIINQIYNTFNTGGSSSSGSSNGGNGSSNSGGAINNTMNSNSVTTNMQSTSAAMNVSAGNINMNILPDPVPNYINFAEIENPHNLSLNSNTIPYEELKSRISYSITNPGIYIIQNTSGYINIALPAKIKNWKEVTIINKTDYGINVMVNSATQNISNYFFTQGDQYVALAQNNTAQFKFVASGPETTEGNWILNLF